MTSAAAAAAVQAIDHIMNINEFGSGARTASDARLPSPSRSNRNLTRTCTLTAPLSKAKPRYLHTETHKYSLFPLCVSIVFPQNVTSDSSVDDT